MQEARLEQGTPPPVCYQYKETLTSWMFRFRMEGFARLVKQMSSFEAALLIRRSSLLGLFLCKANFYHRDF